MSARTKLTDLNKVLSAFVVLLALAAVTLTPLLSDGTASATALYKDGRVVAWDAFSRELAGSLGTAAIGGAYTSNNPRVISVSGGSAHVKGLRLGGASTSDLLQTSVADTNIISTLQIGTIDSSRLGLYYGYDVRLQADGDSYQPHLVINAGGSVNIGAVVVHGGVQTSLGEIRTVLNLHSGQKVDFQVMVTGSSSVTISERAWIDGTTAPAWKSFSDKSSSAIRAAGSVGITTYKSTSGTLGDFSFSALRVWELVLATAPVSSTPPTSAVPATSPNVSATTSPTSTPTTPSPSYPSTPTSAPLGASADAVDLDPSGQTVPDSDYPIPAGALFVSATGSDAGNGSVGSPFATLAHAVAAVPPGGTIVVRAGTYRQGGVRSGKTFTLQAYPHEQVWFDGTDVEPAADWTSDGNGHWYMNWSTPSFCGGLYYSVPWGSQNSDNSGPCTHYDMSRDPANPAAGDPQMVFANGVGQREVTSLSDATGGAFYYDQNARRIYISTNPTGALIELAARPSALILGGSGQRILGIGFRRYATNEYSGNLTASAVYVGASNTTFQNDVFTLNAAQGLILQPRGAVINDSVFAENGFNGMGANGHTGYDLNPADNYDGFTVTDSVFNANNTEHFGTGCTVSCSDAGVKIAHVNTYLFKDDIFSNNTGHGVWCDNNCIYGTMVDNLIYNNSESGVLYEVSSLGVIASNLIYDNGQNGIRVAAATTQVYNNTLLNNGGSASIWIYDDPRYPGNSGGVAVGPDSTDDLIINNVISGSNDLLRIQGQSTAGTNTLPSQIIGNVDYNDYYRTAGSNQNVVSWLSPTAKKVYKSVAAFSKAHGFDTHSTDNLGSALASTSSSGGTLLPVNIANVVGVPAASGSHVGALSYPGE